nr:PAC2 family protein [Candidatus Sigynarchaeota archaeon]
MVVDIKLFDTVDLKGKYLVTGFHGIGVVGYIAVKYMIEATKAKKIGLIISPLTPPLISLDDKGEIQLPFELFMDEHLVYLLIRFQPHPEELHEFTDELAKFIERSGIKGLVLLGGLDTGYKPDDDQKGYKCVVTNGFPIKDPPLIDPGLFISGGIAMLLIDLQLRHIPSLTVFPYAERDHADMKAAAKAIEILNELFSLEIATDKLQEEAKDLEKEVNQILKQQVRESQNNLYT